MGEGTIFQSTVTRWYQRFKEGDYTFEADVDALKAAVKETRDRRLHVWQFGFSAIVPPSDVIWRSLEKNGNGTYGSLTR